MCWSILEPRRSLSTYHRGFGGGFGFGTPVVSYAPRPMLSDVGSLVTMEAYEWVWVWLKCRMNGSGVG